MDADADVQFSDHVDVNKLLLDQLVVVDVDAQQKELLLEKDLVVMEDIFLLTHADVDVQPKES